MCPVGAIAAVSGPITAARSADVRTNIWIQSNGPPSSVFETSASDGGASCAR